MNLTLDDLMEQCSRCGGTGEEKPVAPSGGGSYGPSPIQVWGDTTCRACSGTGRGKLTPLGETLKEFVSILKKRNLI